MSGNRDQDEDFGSLVDEALEETGSSVGPDRGGDLTPEPPVAPEPPDVVPEQAALSTGRQIVQNGEYTVWYGTNRAPIYVGGQFSGFSAQRADKTYYGQCRVFIPKSHTIGSIGSGFWGRLWKLADDRLKLVGTEPLDANNYWAKIRAEFENFSQQERSAVVFIHGYNVSFEEAALRAAQFGVDLKIRTPMAFFSWPSQGTPQGYVADGTTIEVAGDAIEEFLVDFADRSGASVVHIIVHSMGNRGSLAAFHSIAQKARARLKGRFGQVILAAPDVDTDLFRQRCRAYTEMAVRTTLYVSARDRAVGMSAWLNQFSRVGLTPPLFVAPGVDTINVTDVDLTSKFGHGYVAEVRAVLADMHRLLTEGTPPHNRMLRSKRNADGSIYWEFEA